MKGAGMIGKRKGRESGADTRLRRGRWWSPMRDVGMIVEKRGGQILDQGEGNDRGIFQLGDLDGRVGGRGRGGVGEKGS